MGNLGVFIGFIGHRSFTQGIQQSAEDSYPYIGRRRRLQGKPDKRHQTQKTPGIFCHGEQKTPHLFATVDRRHQTNLPPWTEDIKLFCHPGPKTPFFKVSQKTPYCLTSLKKRSNYL